MILDVIEEIDTMLKAHLPAEVEGAGLNRVQDYFLGEKEQALSRFPVIFLLGDETVENEFLGGAVHDENHRISVFIAHRHSDTIKLAHELYKYQALARRVLRANLPQSPAQFVGALNIERHVYSPADIAEGGLYVKDVRLVLDVRERINEL